VLVAAVFAWRRMGMPMLALAFAALHGAAHGNELAGWPALAGMLGASALLLAAGAMLAGVVPARSALPVPDAGRDGL
jgi:hypothetical protein